jgi:hypothetical protein
VVAPIPRHEPGASNERTSLLANEVAAMDGAPCNESIKSELKNHENFDILAPVTLPSESAFQLQL